jgi:hypothetical protein
MSRCKSKSITAGTVGAAEAGTAAVAKKSSLRARFTPSSEFSMCSSSSMSRCTGGGRIVLRAALLLVLLLLAWRCAEGADDEDTRGA